jgi:YegS/Rv2252/BmrU family lipid kinase
VRVCVIFNPTARGEKAKRFRHHLNEIAAHATFKQTTKGGDARRLATEAVKEGFDTIAAAGGDGTLNEVLNGIGDAPNGFEKARLAVLPFGTVNVFAREIAIPAKPDLAWQVLLRGNETVIDLPSVEYGADGSRQRRYFAQLAGAGLDARAVELVKWQVKKLVGPIAYVLAGLHAVLSKPCLVRARGSAETHSGELVLIGNGRLYGGDFKLFPRADLRDGLLEVCVLPRANLFTLIRSAPGLLLEKGLPESVTKAFRADSLTLESDSPAPLQIDGELIGHLPAVFSIEKAKLRVIVP